MTDIQGAIGVVQLAKLDMFIDERDKWAKYYKEQLKDISWLRTPETPNGYKHGWQSYVTYIDESCAPMKRNDIMEFLQQRGISTRPGTHAVHMLDVYAKMYGIKPQDFPNAFNADQYSMSIPMHNKMTKEDFDYIIDAIKTLS
jgi:dTDP-4-amino-4,6-dideoxygalactose transaminase